MRPSRAHIATGGAPTFNRHRAGRSPRRGRAGAVAAPDLRLRREGPLGARLQTCPPHPPHAPSGTPPVHGQAPDPRRLDDAGAHDRRAVDRRLDSNHRSDRGTLAAPTALSRGRRAATPRARAREFFDEEPGPHLRRAFYHELLPHPELVVPLFTDGRPRHARILRAGFPLLRVAMRWRFEISAESAATSRAKMVAAMDRLEHEISSTGYLVGDSLTVADLTAAALFYPVARPPEFPYPMVANQRPARFVARVRRLTRPATRRPMGCRDLQAAPRPIRRNDPRRGTPRGHTGTSGNSLNLSSVQGSP